MSLVHFVFKSTGYACSIFTAIGKDRTNIISQNWSFTCIWSPRLTIAKSLAWELHRRYSSTVEAPWENYNSSQAISLPNQACMVYVRIAQYLSSFRQAEQISLQGKYKIWTPGPWTPFMDRVHGPPIFTTPKITEVNKNKIK